MGKLERFPNGIDDEMWLKFSNQKTSMAFNRILSRVILKQFIYLLFLIYFSIKVIIILLHTKQGT